MSTVITHVFNTHNVRTVEMDGVHMFVAADVADALGYAAARNALAAHCKKVHRISAPSVSSQQVAVIPESDVYRLVMRSKLESAEQFQDWVMETVLPSLRRDGSYIVGEESMNEDQLIAAGWKAMERKLANHSVYRNAIGTGEDRKTLRAAGYSGNDYFIVGGQKLHMQPAIARYYAEHPDTAQPEKAANAWGHKPSINSYPIAMFDFWNAKVKSGEWDHVLRR